MVLPDSAIKTLTSREKLLFEDGINCLGTGDTALTYACENGHTDVANLLLQFGAQLEHESEGGRTPLMKVKGNY